MMYNYSIAITRRCDSKSIFKKKSEKNLYIRITISRCKYLYKEEEKEGTEDEEK